MYCLEVNLQYRYADKAVSAVKPKIRSDQALNLSTVKWLSIELW